MSKPIIAVARELAREVRTQEDNLDIALAGQARLLGALLDARRNAGISARFGSTALDRAFDAVAQTREVRNSMLAMHQELAQMNLRELATGDEADCPEPAGLSVVPTIAVHAA
jgi:hypothetical protein